MTLSARWSFARKAAGALALVILAQWLFYGQGGGATIGGFALAWCIALLVAVPAARRPAPAAALGVAALLSLVMVDDPSLLAWGLCWTALTTAALLPRHRFDDAATWVLRLLSQAAIGVIAPVRDLRKLSRRRSPGGLSGASIATLLALPVIGGAVFLALFAVANPVIGSALTDTSLPSFWDVAFHLAFWGVVFVTMWPTFRPRASRFTEGLVRDGTAAIDLPVATLALSLGVFNAVFLLQNALDIAFLWSGAPLPGGVTLADYAHRGAYTLIATALIAGAFVLVALAPGTRAAGSRIIRRLLVLWIAQNILLVASSILRLVDYIDAYSLTELRIAALAWMALVAVGLTLICWRLLRGKTAAWLVNVNALAAGAVLIAATVVDLGAFAARWNVDQARSADRLDLCYLNMLGSSALLPLADLERRAGGPILRDRARYLRRRAQAALAYQQADWHHWTWRGARRLAAVEAMNGNDPAPLRPARFGRDCDGSINPPPPVVQVAAPPATPVPPTTPLTNGAGQ